MTDLVEAAQKTNSHARPLQELISGKPFHMLSVIISILNSHPTKRVAPSINIPYVPLRTQFLDNHELIALYGMSQPILLKVLHTFVLASSSWACERSFLGTLLCALRLPFDCTVLCGLVPTYGSAIARRSSKSLWFRCPLPIIWSQPTLVKYKASYPCCSTIIYSLFLNLLP
jgi:hypothetical protein